MPSHPTRRVLAGALLLLLIPLSSALGHAELTEADPGPDEVVSVAPAELVARFSQDLQADRTSIELRDPSGQTIASGGKDPDRRRFQRMALPSLAPGEYEVRWVSYSAEDGELARGRYRFTVVTPPPSPSPGPSMAAPCPSVAPSTSASAPASARPGENAAPVPSVLPITSPGPAPVDPCASPLPSPVASPLAPASIAPSPIP